MCGITSAHFLSINFHSQEIRRLPEQKSASCVFVYFSFISFGICLIFMIDRTSSTSDPAQAAAMAILNLLILCLVVLQAAIEDMIYFIWHGAHPLTNYVYASVGVKKIIIGMRL